MRTEQEIEGEIDRLVCLESLARVQETVCGTAHGELERMRRLHRAQLMRHVLEWTLGRNPVLLQPCDKETVPPEWFELI